MNRPPAMIEYVWKMLHPPTCKEVGSPLKLNCQKKLSDVDKEKLLDQIAILYSTCGCEEGSHCSSSIEHGEESNRSVCTTFSNDVRYHEISNFGYVSSWCSCRVIFPSTKERIYGKIVRKVQHPFLHTCDDEVFVCP